MSTKLSLQSAGTFFNDEAKLSDYYFKSSENGEIKVQKKNFFRKVCRWFGITFGYNRKALDATVTKVVNYLKENDINLSNSLNTFITNKKNIVFDKKISQKEIVENEKLLSDFNKRCKQVEDGMKTIQDLYIRYGELKIEDARLKKFDESSMKMLRKCFEENDPSLHVISNLLQCIKDAGRDPSKKIETSEFKSALDYVDTYLKDLENTVKKRIDSLKKDIVELEKANKRNQIIDSRKTQWDNLVELSNNVASKFEVCKELNAECIGLGDDWFEKMKAKLKPDSQEFKSFELKRIQFKNERDKVQRCIIEKSEAFLEKNKTALNDPLAFNKFSLDKIDEIKAELTAFNVVALKNSQDLFELNFKLKSL